MPTQRDPNITIDKTPDMKRPQSILSFIRNSRTFRVASAFTALLFVWDMVRPTVSYALTGGPSQPEVNSFSPAGASDLVNPYTGDFSYSIPLMDVGGYPLALSYQSGISMDQEASMVGLGWNLNTGAITRNMRGIPDEFKGDLVTREMNIKPFVSAGVSVGKDSEIFGTGLFSLDNLGFQGNASINIKYDNYNGISFGTGLGVQASLFHTEKGPNTGGLGLEVTSDPEGTTIRPSVNLYSIAGAEKDRNIVPRKSVGLSFNNRQGISSMNIYGGSVSVLTKTRWRQTFSSVGRISFVDNTYTPQISLPQDGVSYQLALKAGTALFGGDLDANLSGFYSRRELSSALRSLGAYGYNHTTEGASIDTAMLDFNREKDADFSLHTVNLPLTNHTYDIYSIQAQGLAGSFRAHLADISSVHDPRQHEESRGRDLEVEGSFGNVADGGIAFTTTTTVSKSGIWRQDNEALPKLFGGNLSKSDVYEPYYYKQVGELAVDDQSWLNPNSNTPYNLIDQYYSNAAIQFPVDKEGTHNFTLDDALVSHVDFSHQSRRTLDAQNSTRSTRRARNLSIYALDREQAEDLALNPEYVPSSSELPDHHPSEFTLLQGDGSRYVFGLPAINHYQKEVTFNIGDNGTEDDTGLAAYVAGTDNSTSNEKGQNHYYDATTIGPFVHAHMLTAVVSADFSDVDDVQGPSKGDYGSYTKFTYGEPDGLGGFTPDIEDYKWRTPYDQNKGFWNEGIKTLGSNGHDDDKANYTYGRKDIWYMHTVETKTHVAVLSYSAREDAREVLGEDGGLGSRSMKKLDRIDLYSLPVYEAWQAAGGGSPAPQAIQSVHFDYGYTLCDGIPNSSNGGGKLTLEKVWFTYEGSVKHQLSPYEFTYGTSNPVYSPKAMDMWGVYNPNSGSSDGTLGGNLLNAEFPYAEQDVAARNADVAAWCLAKVTTPSGGEMEIHYESDDYKLVQNKRAMAMQKIIAASNSDDYGNASANTLYSTNTDFTAHDHLFFVMPNDRQSALDSMCNFGSGELMFFRFLLDLDDETHYDYVEGWCEVESYGFATNTAGSDIAYIKVKKVKLGDRENDEDGTVHPISKAGWNYGRMHNPRLVYQMQDPDDSDAQQLVRSLAQGNIVQSIIDLVRGANRQFRDKEYSRKFNNAKSWVRVYHTGHGKLGGGHRVSKITFNDDWSYNSGVSNNDFLYGMEYQYVNPDGTSSGVATYEPLISRENPLVRPVVTSTVKALAPDDKHYQTTPFGESFMPSPSVGYRTVVIKALERTGVTRHATGHTVNEYYTAYDFPTIANQTRLDAQRSPKITNLLGQMLSLTVRDFVTLSQGYTVETFADYYGKPRRVRVYGEGQASPISGMDFIYDFDDVTETLNVGSASYQYTVRRPDNKVVTIHPDGSVKEDETIGVDVDIVMDFREYKSTIETNGANGNLAVFMALAPIPVPTVIPTVSKEETQFRSAVTTKVINRYAILREVVAHDLGASVKTRNLAWDSETGNVLLTETTNEYDDKLYSLAYPAHWAYEGMAQGYKNILQDISFETSSDGEITTGATHLVPGDEVAYNGTRYWVMEVDSPSVGTHLVDENGLTLNNVTPAETLTVVRSGRRNQQSIGIGSVIMKKSPIHASDGTLLSTLTVDDTKQILQSGVVEFSEDWKTIEGVVCPSPTASATVSEGVSFINKMITEGDLGNGSVATNLTASSYTGFSNLYAEMGTDFGACSGATMANQLNSAVVDEANYLMTCSTSTCNFHFRIVDAVTDGNDLTNISSVGVNYQFYQLGNTSAHIQMRGIWPDGTIKRMELVSTTCLDIGDEVTCPDPKVGACGLIVGDVVNPYVEGLRGNFRSLRSLVTLEDRVQHADALALVGSNNQINLRDEGHFEDFTSFWQYNSLDGRYAENNGTWTWASEASDFLPFGMAVESRDALYRYSAEVVGYNYTLPVAVGSNSSYQQIGFDGFEDYDYLDNCQPPHFNSNAYGATLTEGIAHTGRYCYTVKPGDAYSIISSLQSADPTGGARDVPYTLKGDDVMKRFAPQTYNLQSGSGEARDYVVSVWVKAVNTANAALTDYTNASINLTLDGVAQTPSSSVRGAIVDGWQRLEAIYLLPASSSADLSISVGNSDDSESLYVDDVRVHPLNASFKSFVYDPVSLRLWAELDNNNYATFYEYDEQGHLARVKKETVRGIVTLQENRQSLVKINP